MIAAFSDLDVSGMARRGDNAGRQIVVKKRGRLRGKHTQIAFHRFQNPLDLASASDMGTGVTAYTGTAASNPVVYDIDGFGNPPNKISKYHLFARRRPPWFNGFKLFYHEDTHMMSPRAVMRLHPRPNVVIYE